MDINSLLSPTDSSAPEGGATPPAGTPAQLHTTAAPAPTSVPAAQSSPRRLPGHDSPPGPKARPPMPSPPIQEFPHRAHRAASTAGMDTLADLAAMQHPQHTTRSRAGSLRNNDPMKKPPTPVSVRPSLEAIARTHSGSRSSLDIRMADVPAQTPPPRVFTAPSLTGTQRQRVQELVAELADHAHAYDKHLELIRLLYDGFTAHVFPTGAALPENDPLSYELLGELRQALEAMSSRFSLGEELWEIRLRTLQLTAVDIEGCVALMESFEKAVAECPASTTLWSMYAEWFLALYAGLQPSDTEVATLHKPHDMPLKLSEEDQMVLAEVFTKAQLMDVWKRAAVDTKYRIDNSSLVWDKWIDLQLASLGPTSAEGAIDSIRSLLMERLTVPHSTWDNTFQRFSSFVSTYENARYEETMVAVNRQTGPAKTAYREREAFENRLRRAVEASDKAAELAVYGDYTEWEWTGSRSQRLFNYDLGHALFQRFVLRFPFDANAWEDYLTFLGDEAPQRTRSAALLAVLDRASNHCPWSGSLWELYIKAAEAANLEFGDLSQIKHKATSTGLLDLGSMEEVLKIQTALCGFLRRQAFRSGSTDEELDVAEVGIRSAIEDTETLGKSKYGTDYKGDPQYRLERIYIKFQVQSRNYGGARDTWKKLIPRHGDSYEFWLRYYGWEMMLWGMMLNAESSDAARQRPMEATAVLQHAMQRPHLDWPEKVIETYLSHCEEHESIDELQSAILRCRKAAKLVNRRREREAQQAAEQMQAQAQAYAAVEEPLVAGSTKRKREAETDAASKKSRAEAPETGTSMEHAQQAKRDRENSTVVVQNLPTNTSEKHLRHFFHECGPIKHIQLIAKAGSTTATVEFESKDDALTAHTKDQKLYEEQVISVQIGTGTTLYVTNFPATADEAYIRDLFAEYGSIADVRFPSLKFDTHRRFCYVQFSTAEAASAATALDGQRAGDLHLLVKLSDPGNRQARHGAMHEGREVFVSNLDWSATENDVSKLFAKYGTVEKARVPRKVDGKSKGMAFVAMASKDEAQAALDLHATKYKTRILTVELSAPQGSKNKRLATLQGPRAASPAEDTSSGSGSGAHDRTIALLGVPDTVNVARIHALAEPHGALVKVLLRPEKGGALVEFAAVAAAGAASLALEGAVLDGATLRVGTPGELRSSKAVHRETAAPAPAPAEKHKKDAAGALAVTPASLAAPVVRRPGLGAPRGRRGGLGTRMRPPAPPAGEGNANTNANGSAEEHAKEETPGGSAGRSNADFKALFVKAKAQGSGEGETAE